jgi:thiamine kinase-like enzyme
VWDQKENTHLVKKQFQTKNKYERERDFYINFNHVLSYIPRLVRWNDVEKTIWTEYCGISLNLKYPPKERYKFKSQIRFMVDELRAVGYYHNDIRWKNIVENENGRLFLIDFEVVSIDNKERDPEWILRDKN